MATREGVKERKEAKLEVSLDCPMGKENGFSAGGGGGS